MRSLCGAAMRRFCQQARESRGGCLGRTRADGTPWDLIDMGLRL
jgi:hypothetical protein